MNLVTGLRYAGIVDDVVRRVAGAEGFLFHKPKELAEIDRLLGNPAAWTSGEIGSLGA
jgi:hypothetical protein